MSKAIARMHELTFSGIVFALVALTILASGCAVQPKVNTIEDQVAVGYATVNGVANSVSVYLEAGLLPVDQAVAYRDQLVDIKGMLDTASIAIGVNKPKDALEGLQLANRLLLELQIKLQEQVDKGKAGDPVPPKDFSGGVQ